MQSRIAAIYQYWNKFFNSLFNDGVLNKSDKESWHHREGAYDFWFHPDNDNRYIRVSVAKMTESDGEGSMDEGAGKDVRVFDFCSTGILLEITDDLEIDERFNSSVCDTYDAEIHNIVVTLYLKPYQEQIKAVIDSDEVPAIIAAEIQSIPPGSNPYIADTMRIGVPLMEDIEVLYSLVQEHQIILVNTRTGRCASIDFSGLNFLGE